MRVCSKYGLERPIGRSGADCWRRSFAARRQFLQGLLDGLRGRGVQHVAAEANTIKGLDHLHGPRVQLAPPADRGQPRAGGMGELAGRLPGGALQAQAGNNLLEAAVELDRTPRPGRPPTAAPENRRQSRPRRRTSHHPAATGTITIAINTTTPNSHPIIPLRNMAAKEAHRPAASSLHQRGSNNLPVRFRVAREIGS